MTTGSSPLKPAWHLGWEHLLTKRSLNQGHSSLDCLWIHTSPSCLNELKSLAHNGSQVLLARVYRWRGVCLGCHADRFNRSVGVCTALWTYLVKERLEWDLCCGKQIPCLCVASLLSTVLCFLYFPCSFIHSESSSDIPGEVWQGMGWQKSLHGHSYLSVEHHGVTFTVSSGT